MTRLIGANLIELTAGPHRTTITLDEFKQITANLSEDPMLHLRVAEYRDPSGLIWVLDEWFIAHIHRYMAAVT
ncbi:hypothetical protein ANRL4_02809 [Anaerolineae bacterium]|nr:hypothetical protein ANRL4_02809 [Anaerolineae bacterium]